MPVVVGTSAAALATGGGLLGTTLMENGAKRAGIVGGIAVGVGLAAAGAAILIRRHVEKMPPLPDRSDVPTLPLPGNVSPLPQGLLPEGTRVGYTYESDYVCTEDSDGDRTCHWETDYDEIKTADFVGNREGYGTVQAAVMATRDNTSVIVRRESNGRFRPYILSDWVNQSPDQVRSVSSDVAAFVSTSGYVFDRPVRGGTLDYGGIRVNRVDNPHKLDPGDKIARLSLFRRLDGGVNIRGTVSDPRGIESLDAALGEAALRPGDHAVVEEGGRYHVQRLIRGKDNDKAKLDGILQEKDSKHVTAMEYRGETLVRAGDYWVGPKVASK
jgi:hypothetical protein